MNKISLQKPYYLIYPRHVVLIVSQADENSNPNVMTAAWSSYVSIKPPIFSICITQSRYTYKLIQKSKQFTINVPTIDLIKETFYFGSVSGRNINKFEHVDLTLSKGEKIFTPIINECISHFECKVVNQVKMGDHYVIFGEILANYTDENVLKNGFFDLSNIKLIYHCGGNKFTTNSNEIIEVEKWWNK